MIEAELSNNLIDQILNDDDLFILIDDLQNDVTLVATIGILSSEFGMRKLYLLPQLMIQMMQEMILTKRKKMTQRKSLDLKSSNWQGI